MADVEIRTFTVDDADAVLSVILPIQREEFGIDITVDAQPDLRVIPDFYQSGKGQFWVAVKDGAIVGTVGLKDIGNNHAALRKMFVSAEVRGREHGVAARLLDRLFAHARDVGLTDIFLGTTDKFVAAHRFYEKNGFTEIAKSALPRSFPLMAVDSKFYRYKVG
ncbi:GNAT family N-acetyltransferase [Rhizobium leguminosarum]|jgi:N-acetylglutamate synthase-like GNAT family acetyltransferase|uniref:GNAT family N-acetyltransferase n=2 Tax=Rhizobium TaxID=379 RepID=A0A444HZQ4_RHILE|nr:MULTISPECIES: GNAT family N-acetyltransferase [Rhizobium]NKL66047.1 GNAT family N-acetyltransferase [Rhizobium leguminosarum bv. viciae]RWX03982.1 GNAT family N-acetyltransferase [Rhizobium leguminosarum]RWX29960.1 GNAT family N-acetyltransferase [Rhizobium leguminosarum]TBC71954.1 GNAT family N-acetyltransferase [Rhizobium leguminosarum]TBC93109.1 GNAT family N-acetyltransferase [Rhizobium leguminosarum]